MKISQLTWFSLIFSSISLALFLLLSDSHHPPMALLSLSAALVFFAIAVKTIIDAVDKRHAGQLKEPMQIGSVAFVLTGATGAGRSLYLGIITGAWEYWAIMVNLLLFVVGVLVLWYNSFIKKLLADAKEK